MLTSNLIILINPQTINSTVNNKNTGQDITEINVR